MESLFFDDPVESHVLDEVAGVEESLPAEAAPEAPIDAATATLLRARGSIPGAATSHQDFQRIWHQSMQVFSALNPDEFSADLGTAHTIVGEVERLTVHISQTHRLWESQMVTFGVCVLSAYKKRLTDMTEMDHVRLLWIACGDTLLRSHSGVVYMYDPVFGCWSLYEGIVPEHILHHVQRFGLIVEGIFRKMGTTGRATKRDDKAVLDEMRSLRGGLSIDVFVQQCVMASVWNLGEASVSPPEEPGVGDVGAAGMGVAGDANEAPEAVGLDALAAAAGAKVPWPILVARSIGKAFFMLVRQLENGRVLPKFAEWCKQEMKRTKGVAYGDCVTLYDVPSREDIVTFARRRGAYVNLYVKISRNLLTGIDPTLLAALDRLERAYQETFWTNAEGFRFGQACLVLAARGLNVNQITVYWGPGGVGMSSYTAHLSAMLGENNHVMFDPNIFYDDTELRTPLSQNIYVPGNPVLRLLRMIGTLPCPPSPGGAGNKWP